MSSVITNCFKRPQMKILPEEIDARAMTAIRETLCNLNRVEIPRPQFHGLQFVATRGRLGFYKTIRQNGAQFGLQVKPLGPRRTPLTSARWAALPGTPEEPAIVEQRPSLAATTNTNYSSNQMPVLQHREDHLPPPDECTPDYPGYDPNQSYSMQNQNNINSRPPEIIVEKL